MAILNLSAGLVITSWPERQGDLDMIEGWGQQWLVAGMNLYATDAMPNYPPHAVVALSPLGILSHIWAVRVWTILNLCLAVVAPVLAVRIVRPLAAWPAIALPILMFLCWGGFRTLLQFSLVTLVFGLLSMKLADRRPAWSGVCLGIALMKPHMAAPFVLWAVFTRRLRVVAIGVTVVIAGLLIFCIRVKADPIAVVQSYARILHTFYMADDGLLVGLAQLRPLIALAISDPGIVKAVAIAIAMGLLALICVLGFAEGKRRDVLMVSAPPLVGVWSLLTFYHLTYGFILLLPVATLLIFENDPATRAFRRAVFWMLQLALMVDVPGMWRRFAPALLPGRAAELWTLPAHADRVLMAALFVCLLVLAFRRRRASM
jgi:hypothetical protein